jgi:formate dehydrogenase iron-sulfur subunit
MKGSEPTVRDEWRVVLDLGYCIGCRSCSAACAQGHRGQPLLGHGRVYEIALLPQHCKHCEAPTCLPACPAGAITREEGGKVIRWAHLCVGCLSCAHACPFGVIDTELTFVTSPNCDLCRDRLERGLEPRCVATCVSGALSFRPLSELTEAGDRIGARITRRR